MTVHPEDRVASFVAADPLTVWEMVSDITRMGDWSPECYKAMWLGPKCGKGSVFLGMNKDRGLTWPSPAIVTESEPGKIYAFRAASGVIWRYLVSPEDCGTRLIEERINTASSAG
jgi:dimethylaniline monooxygenase (N-oxide forming)